MLAGVARMHNVSTAVRYPGQLTVTAPPPGLRARMWAAPTPLLTAVAVFTPVAPEEAWRSSALSMAGVGPRSIRSVIPAGCVHWFVVALELFTANEATTMALATVVVMLGVQWVVLLAVARPFSTSIGVVVLTPEYAEMEPTMVFVPLVGVNAQS